MTQKQITMLRLIEKFGENAQIKLIAQYAEDEFMVPYQEAVKTINDIVEYSI